MANLSDCDLHRAIGREGAGKGWGRRREGGVGGGGGGGAGGNQETRPTKTKTNKQTVKE